MILHLVNRSPLQSQALELCLRFASEQDCLLLLEDGVVAAAAAHLLPQRRPGRVAALRDDVVSRGLSDRLAPGVEVVDYNEFVAMCTQCDRVQSWF